MSMLVADGFRSGADNDPVGDSKVVSAQNTWTAWIPVKGPPGAITFLPHAWSTTTSVVVMQRTRIGGGLVVDYARSDGESGASGEKLPKAGAMLVNAGYQYRMGVPTGGYGNTVTLEIGV